MAVNLHGDSWVGVTELLADVEYIGTIAEELRGEGVPEVVKPDVPKTRLAKHPLKVASFYVVEISETPTMVRKDPLRDFISTLFHRLFLHLAAKVAQGFY